MQTIGIKIKGREATADIRWEAGHALVIDIRDDDGGFDSYAVPAEEVDDREALILAAEVVYHMLEGREGTNSDIEHLVRLFEQVAE